MNFRQFLENIDGVKGAINTLLLKSKALPSSDDPHDLFGKKNHKSILVPYYEDLLKNLDETLAQMLSGIPLSDDPLVVYRTINAGGHPVRDYLILKAHGLLNRPSQP